ncbi:MULTISPECIES: type IV toxin-antitoxin system AbiEi family antitoxin [Paraburkholderia]|uniref:type IV toxin-antitoxin system AbiEi family antitoxin n=1 Tax=Paraburkholderia TaxID=1822464 RepID=UPI00224E10FB|nr:MULTISPECIES: type IV toxin-antitoxin system AbiEi family antitoxin [Paraburkholderia]MCX4163591.1 type IV toxin-antitoxin system AbiEi family antitoxin [Paraburkholderia megapolitana]MDN7159086.1 type IV toxin-antitoxin system AbiEi family antitoxin [Paraburkholderia sp. CHISQ3]MDQ6496133.1 type IV toxin-antitoxin system AbiEi family antitoxin [Paraburkholderia megapolitana]
MKKTTPGQQGSARLAYETEVADRLCALLVNTTGGQITSRQARCPIGNGLWLDLLLTLSVGNESVNIAVETLRHAYPRDIRETIWKLDEYRLSGDPERLITLVAAGLLSPGARDLLRRRGIGYFEFNGNLNLRWRNWLINIQCPEPVSSGRHTTELFTGSRERVVHALLVHRQSWLTGSELALMSQTSPYTCSVVMQELERREWCESSGAGPTLRRHLTGPRQLLDAWAERWTRRKAQRSRWYTFIDYPGRMLAELSARIEKGKVESGWAFTGTAAANAWAPLLTAVDTAELIIPPGHIDQFTDALKLTRAEKGANVTLVEREGASLLFRDRHPDDTSWFASPFILYLDLLDGRGRNRELAQHVLEKLEL